MASVTSLGVGSGLDAESIISSLMAVERRPVTLLTTEISDIKTQVSSIGKLKSLAATMTDKAAAVAALDLWNRKSVSTSDATVATGSAGSTAVAGSYSVTVQGLASAQTVTSAALASSASTLSEGTLTLELGTWTGTPLSGFAAKSGSSPVTLTIGAGETSLASIRDKINAAGAGVTASIVNDASGARLSLRSTATGAENAFRLTATETVDDGDSATGLSALGYTALASSPMSLNQAAGNAKATVNGIPVQSATNTFSEVDDGMSFTVGKVSATAVEVGVNTDTEAIKTAVTDFVKAFNELASYIKDQTKYDATAKTGGPLQGDRTAIGLQWQLRGVLNQGSSASSSWSRLSDVGITMKQDGTLSTSTSKLDEALKNPAELRKLLATDAGTTAASGFMDRFRDLGKQVTGTDGNLVNRETALNDRIKRNEKRQEQLEDRLALVEKRMRAQYEALDTSMASLSALSSYVTQQFGSGNSG